MNFRRQLQAVRAALPAGILFWAGVAPALAPASQAPARPPERQVDYDIEARLDGDTKILTASEVIRWTYPAGEDVNDLAFHLYLNAFSNNRSTHLVEGKGKLRGRKIEDGWGWSRVESVEVQYAGGDWEDVSTSLAYVQPDGGSPEDRTVFEVDLPRPFAAGGTLNIRVKWTCQLPRVRRRTGFKDDFLLVAQWFPKLGVYEPGRGWNCHEFHANSEFYSDYGYYDVTLDLPKEYNGKVGGSGVLVLDRLEGADRCQVRFVAPAEKDRVRPDRTGALPRVHDFTWTADPRFVVYRDTFRYSEWAEDFPGEVQRAQDALGADKDLTLRNVDVTVLIHPEREDQAFRHFHATSAALFFYGLWFGEYPYEHVTVVDPAWGGGAAGGMEYPTLFTCGTALFTTPDTYRPESVTVHECGHQFWYGLVGNNEFEGAWLDEGFNSFADSEVLKRVYGDRRSVTSYAGFPVNGVALAGLPGGNPAVDALAAKRIPLPVVPDLVPLRGSALLDWWRDQPALAFVPEWTDPRWGDRNGYLRDPDIDPIDTAAWEYVDRASYRTNSYPRPAVALRSLAAVVGDGAFLRGMRHYSETWRYRHPYSEDFFRDFQVGADVDIDWYFREIFQGTGTIDWSVSVSQARRPEPVGFFQSEGGEFRERTEVEDDATEEEDEGEAGPGKAPWESEVVLRKRGSLALPVDVLLVFRDGTEERMRWTREQQLAESWLRVELEGHPKLVAVRIDPERRWFLDTDMSNNQWYADDDSLTGWRWAERVFSRYGHYLHFVGGVGG
jgi:hypothetical protein